MTKTSSEHFITPKANEVLYVSQAYQPKVSKQKMMDLDIKMHNILYCI